MDLRAKILIRGAVQGVGFRPFIYKLAKELGLVGYVLNSSIGVTIEIEGNKTVIDKFISRLEKEKPPRSIIISMEISYLDKIGYNSFIIKHSEKTEELSALILPDIAVCSDCLNELFDPGYRRYLYPFINCTNCGPRYTIIEKMPYDRPNTSMKIFEMCSECKWEYENPLDRRFHAQPIACPQCGPHVEMWDARGNVIEVSDWLNLCIELINQGQIIALKGIGGFHLICDANNDEVIIKLRRRKRREEKPFALMYPSIEMIKKDCTVDEQEERLLKAPEAPIVLLKKRRSASKNISDHIAPNNPYLGIMLPYAPIHHLIMKKLNKPIVATSGNISEEPICIDEIEALTKLHGIADYFIVHNRPIVRHCDDSIVRVVKGKEFMIRRARGYAPLPIEFMKNEMEENIIAVGGHLKNTISIRKKNLIYISQHIGDLSTEESFNAFTRTTKDMKDLLDINNFKFVGDLHPGYMSTKFIQNSGINFTLVQHHLAHVISCKIENEAEGSVLGISWDGTGYGLDGKIWGSEFFICDEKTFKHVGQFRKFCLPSGEKAIKETKRILVGIFYELFGESCIEQKILASKFSKNELETLIQMIKKRINAPECVSAGRLFDAVSSLLDISDYSNFEGQAAMMLEFAIRGDDESSYEFEFHVNNKIIIDWEKIIKGIIIDYENGIDKGIISRKFHNTLVEVIVKFAKAVNMVKVILSGGCFQNVYLLERTIQRLNQEGLQAYWHQRVPTNDGGISFGQIGAMYLKNCSD